MKKSAAVPSGAPAKRRLREFIRRSLLLARQDDVKPRARGEEFQRLFYPLNIAAHRRECRDERLD
jgi:hypothetical protein